MTRDEFDSDPEDPEDPSHFYETAVRGLPALDLADDISYCNPFAPLKGV